MSDGENTSRRRYSQQAVDRMVADAGAARQGDVTDLVQRVSDLSTRLERFMDAVIGVEGVSKGALNEIRDNQQQFDDEWKAFQTAFPSAMNAAIEAYNRTRVTNVTQGTRRWLAQIGAMAIASILASSTTTILFVTHIVAPAVNK